MKRILSLAWMLIMIAGSLSGTNKTLIPDPTTDFSRQLSIYKGINRDGVNPGDKRRMKWELLKVKSEKKYAEINGAFLPGQIRHLKKAKNIMKKHPGRGK